MTGGRKPIELEEDEHRSPRRRVWEPSCADVRVDAILNAWIAAMRFRREAIRLLRRSGLTFLQWRVLLVIERLVREQGDAVSQRSVAQRLAVDEGDVSAAMNDLMRLGLADVDTDAWGYSYRALATDEGLALLARVWPAIELMASPLLGRGRSEVCDGGASERLDGDLGQNFGNAQDPNGRELGLEQLADIATDIRLGEDDDRLHVTSVRGNGTLDGGDDVAGGDGGEREKAAGGCARDGAADGLFDVRVQQQDGELARTAG